MPIHDLKQYQARCDECGRLTVYEAVNRLHVPFEWTVTLGKTLADVRVLCPMCAEIERMEAEHE